MSLTDDINNLPATPQEVMPGHLNHHATIHSALKHHNSILTSEAVHHRGAMASGTTLDDYANHESVGQWYSTRVEQFADAPFTQYGSLEVLELGTNILQRYIEFGRYRVWLRWVYPGGATGTWTQVDATAAPSYYRGSISPGESFDSYALPSHGGQWLVSNRVTEGPISTTVGVLECLAMSNSSVQRFTAHPSGDTYVRTFSGGTPTPWTKISATAPPSYYRGSISPGESFDSYALPSHAGQWLVASGVTEGPISSTLGVLECLAMQYSSVQRFTAHPSGDTYVRNFSGGTPTQWTKISTDPTPPPTPTTPGISSVSGFKRIPLAVTLGLGASSAAPLSQEVRYCIHFNAPITRWRLHIAARDARNNNVVAGAVDFQQWVLGGEGVGGAYIDPQTVLPAFSMDEQGFVSGWVNTPIPTGEPLLLGTSYVAQNAPWIQVGACWRGATSDSLSQETRAPFEVWIEAETYATTPAIAVLGSSSDTGVGGSRPVVDSTISKYARDNGALPVHYASSGDGMVSSTNKNAYKWNRWQDCDRPDAVLWALGSNDVYGTKSLEDIQGYHEKVAEIVRDKVSDVIYGATVFQRASGDVPKREPYNDWLKTLPNGIRDVFDFSSAIGSPPEPDFDADGVHINDQGHDAILSTLTRPLIAPAPMYHS